MKSINSVKNQNMEKTNFRTFLGFLLVLLNRICVCSAIESDIYCLKSIKDSLYDPHNNLGSWDFSNYTEGFICRFSGIRCWHIDETRVISIELSGYGLIGEFPRGIRNCTSLTSLDLSGNNLYGTIPSDISRIIGYVVLLDLSNNMFSGDIPPSIANCSFLNALKLDNNNLEGEIPSGIGYLSRLKTFSVASNYLIGTVPLFVSVDFPKESFANNSELCGKPLKACEEVSWMWKHIDPASFIKAFVVAWVLFFTLVLVLCLYKFPTKAFNKIVSLNKWKLRSKKRTNSGSEEELSSQHKVKILLSKDPAKLPFLL